MLKSCIFCLIALVCLLPAGLPTLAADNAKDKELLQGTWVCVVTLKDGQAVETYVGVRAKIEGDTLTWYFPQKDGSYREQKNSYRIDSSKNPKHFDWWIADKTPISPDFRLFTVTDGQLRMLTNLDYKTRPATFEAGKWQFTCKRVVK